MKRFSTLVFGAFLEFGIWDLEFSLVFGAFLEFGIWDLEFSLVF
jgi:hypothetical protein